MIRINKKQVKKIGKKVKTLELNPGFYEREFLLINSPIKMEMYFYSVGICHQTHLLANPKLNIYGWDFLEYGFLEILKNSPSLLDSKEIVKLSREHLIEKIKPFFSPDHNPKKCTLDNLEERADLWLDMAENLVSHFDGKVENIFAPSDWKKTQNAEFFYQRFPLFKAFSDPLQKKTSFFLKLVHDAGLFNLGNLKNVIPIMDYHMQRLMLRTGCVEITDKKLKNELLTRTPILDDTVIRKTCIEAMASIAQISEKHIFKMNDVFYTLGRSCCAETTLCHDHVCEKTPCSLTKTIYLERHTECIFQKVCKGANDETYRLYWQPVVETHFY
jgi:hypothetical protein